MRGGEDFVGWGLDRYILVAILESIRENTWSIIAANSKKKPKEPPPIPRPEDKAKKAARRSESNLFRQMAAAHITAARKAKAISQGG